jgi:hypothetical protein
VKLLDVRPVLAANDVLHGGRCDTERRGDVLVHRATSAHRSDATHIVGSQARTTVALTDARSRTTRVMRVSSHGSSPTLAVHVGDVVQLRSKEEVVRPDTPWVVASVQNAHIGWDRAKVEHPRHAMRTLNPEILKLDVPVLAMSAALVSAGPQPAAVTLCDLRPEAIWKRDAASLSGHGEREL